MMFFVIEMLVFVGWIGVGWLVWVLVIWVYSVGVCIVVVVNCLSLFVVWFV